MPITLPPYSGAFTLKQLEDRCNHDEDVLTAKLVRLEAVRNSTGAKGTEATYQEQENGAGLGKVRLAVDAKGKDTAHIVTVKRKILISRAS